MPEPDRPRVSTRLRERPRRSMARALCGTVALAMAAGVVSIGPSPVGAAAAEVDTDRLSGATRYATAVEVAEAYVDEIEADRSSDDIDTVILTSGEDEHFAYAVPVPALARQRRAPLLLTPTDELHAEVRDFIEDYDIAEVIIIGGTDVVSGDVEDELEDIAGIDVERIGGDDEYRSAVEVADEVGTPGDFGRSGRTAFLATGEAFADALAVGAIAYRGEHSILLTPSDSIPDDVLDFIDDSRIEHVVILGGTAAVSQDIQDDVEDLGVDVTRWSGATRIETAIEIAKALLGDDSPQTCFDGSEVGLAFAWKHPDAIVSGPYLGELCAPLLLTDRRALPDDVIDLLEGVEFFTGDERGRLRITAFGGTAAISGSALGDAADVAELESLDASVTASEGACHFTVTFSEPVLIGDALDVTNYLIAGQPIDYHIAYVEAEGDETTSSATVLLDGALTEVGTKVPTGCTSPLGARDTVGVTSNRIHAADEIRTVRRTDVQVRADSVRPRVTITAAEDAVEVLVEVDEPVVPAGDDGVIAVKFERLVPGSDPDMATVDNVQVPAGATRFEVEVPNVSPFNGSLLSRDRVILEAGELGDLAGNANIRVTRTVVVDNTGPRVSRVTVTDPVAGESAFVELSGEDSGGGREYGALRITTKEGSAADGAAGNDWFVDAEVVRRRPRDWGASQYVQVDLSQSRRTISITMIDVATLADVEDGLNDDPDFSELFTPVVTPGAEDLLPLGTGGPLAFRGGSSTVDITVYWSEPVKDCVDSTTAQQVEPSGIQIDVDRDGEPDFDLGGSLLDGDSDVTFVADPSGKTSIQAGAATCDTITPGARSGTLVARVQSLTFDDLPNLRSTARVLNDAAFDLSGNPNVPQRAITLRPARS